MEGILYNVANGLLVAFIILVIRHEWPVIRDLFDAERRRQARQIRGTWEGTESFNGSATQDTFTMRIKCKGGRITGTQTCLTGPDQGLTFDIEGSYKDHILAFTWMPDNRAALESGTTTVRLVKDNQLEGHGVYIEPDDGKVYTSSFSAKKKS